MKVRTRKIETSIARLEFNTLAGVRQEHKGKVVGEALRVAANLFIQAFGWYTVELRKVRIQNHAPTANGVDAARIWRCDSLCNGAFHVAFLLATSITPSKLTK